uniref:Epidermal growth factor receptor kinase substrate 8 n=1 Tax=Aceria tosichella TaxID=561515 RepID=A0A6G1SLQ5_9ACAR
MTTIIEKQAQHPQITKQKHGGTEQETTGKPGAAADGKLSSDNDDDKSSSGSRQANNTKTTNDETTATTITTTTTAATTNAEPVQYDVEHLATFSTVSSHEQQVGAATTTTTTKTNNNRRDESSRVRLKQQQQQQQASLSTNDSTTPSSSITEPREALQKLFELEKLSGIWTQRMQIELQQEFMFIVDCETKSVVERFHRDRVTKPEAFNHHNDIYNNIVVFNIDHQPAFDIENRSKTKSDDKKTSEECDTKTSSNGGGELHIFQCVSHQAKHLVSDILAWKSQALRVVSDEPKADVMSEKESKTTTMPSSGPTTISNDHGISFGKETTDKVSSRGLSQKSSEEVLRKQLASTEDETSQAQPPPSTTAAMSDNNHKPVVLVASSSKSSETVPIVNVNVKETVQVFNQIAALREKSSGVGQAARPLSDASSSSQTGSAGSTHPPGSSSGSSEFSRAPLGPSGQSYKQRSIRATLAPKAQQQQSEQSSNKDKEQAKQAHHNHSNQDHRSTSSSSSITSSTEQNNNNGAVVAKFASGSSVEASSQSDHHHHHHQQHNSTGDQSLGQASSSSSTAAAGAAKHHDASSQQPAGQKHTTGQHHNSNSNNSHTQSSPSSHHNHNHQQQQQQRLVKAKSSGNKLGSAPTRLPPATNGHHNQLQHQSNHHHQTGNAIQSSSSSGRSRCSPTLQQQQQQIQTAEQVTSNESYVSVLNHCFDDIEKFILRIQHAYAAMRELQAKKKQTKRMAAHHLQQSNNNNNKAAHQNGPLPPGGNPISASELAMLSAQARGPSADDFFEILSKFKLAFNLLAKLKGCIHEPNAPELVHFLFTPLAIIIESARNVTPPVDPTVVGIPYLNRDALELLSNCCTSKESDLWLSLGPNWTETIDAQLLKASRLPSSFQPIFSDGWAPVISELELIGLVVPSQPVTTTMSLADVDSHYCSSGPVAGNQLAMDETMVARTGAPPTLPVHSSSVNNNNNGILSSSSSSSSAAAVAKAKRRSPPNGALNSAYADPMLQTTTGHYHHHAQPLRESSDPELEGPLAIVDGNHKHHSGHRHSQPPKFASDKSNVIHRGATAKHSAGSRRNSDYITTAHGPYAQASMLNSSFIGPHEADHSGLHHLNDRYSATSAAGYPPTNPSDDYTELQTTTNHYLAGPSATRRHSHSQHQGHLGHYAAGPLPPPLPPPQHQLVQRSSDPARRRASKGSYNTPRRQQPYNMAPELPLYDDDYDDDGGGQQHHDGQHIMDGVGGHDLTMMHEIEREAMLVDMGPAQTEWFYELKLRGALIVRVLFTREANNDKELTVKRGEILEVLDDTRKWWKARNIELQVAYVPHTIVAVMEHYQTLDELLTGSSGDTTTMMMMMNHQQQQQMTMGTNSQRYITHHNNHHREPPLPLPLPTAGQVEDEGGEFQVVNQYHHGEFREGRRNSKAAKGAFRYF